MGMKVGTSAQKPSIFFSTDVLGTMAMIQMTLQQHIYKVDVILRTFSIKDFGNLIPIRHRLLRNPSVSTGAPVMIRTIVLLVTHLVKEISIERLHGLYRLFLGGMALDLHKEENLYLKGISKPTTPSLFLS